MSFTEARTGVAPWADRLAQPVVFACFFASGFASLLYQIVWTRLAFAQFGVITPVLSLIVSVFMLGLGLGAARGAIWGRALGARFGLTSLQTYAAAELLTALGAIAVPAGFALGGRLLLGVGAAGSAAFLALSAVVIVFVLLPWCIAMGATVPLMMGFARRRQDGVFSFLYAANVLGAATGAIATALVLIELRGLRGTLQVGAAGNIAAAVLALALARTVAEPATASAGVRPAARAATARPATVRPVTVRPAWPGIALAVTGFASMGMEVCWTRDFTFTLATTIYAFAAILAVYLLATFAGSLAWRHLLARGLAPAPERLLGWALPLALLPVLLADPRLTNSFTLGGGVQVLFSIVPFCGLLGALTPGLIDRFAAGEPRRAGVYYALNIAGGILGPLVAGYLLLPLIGIRWAILLLALPLPVVALAANGWRVRGQAAALFGAALLLPVAVFASHAWDEAAIYPRPHLVHRDDAASIVAWGRGRAAQLAVNGVWITTLTNETKIMAHLPMALVRDPHSALDICFGMGTTFQSLASWDGTVVGVDLSRSVIRSFGFFHKDAAKVLARPQVHTVVDDGRRYLERTQRRFDVITIDPPPPVAAAGSSLLYSVQFYRIAARRLAPGGILAQWLPSSGPRVRMAVVRALHHVFPYVVAFRALRGTGVHLMASMTPIAVLDAAAFIARMPPAARRDLLQWEGGRSLAAVVHQILALREPLAAVLPAPGAGIPLLTDDHPYNEYFLLRRLGWTN